MAKLQTTLHIAHSLFRCLRLTLPCWQDLMENLLVERGEDQLVEVDEATETNSELLQLLADWSQTSWERRRGLMLTGLQGRQEIVLDTRLWEERRRNLRHCQINMYIKHAASCWLSSYPWESSYMSLFLPISLRIVLSGWMEAEIWPLRVLFRSAENGE